MSETKMLAITFSLTMVLAFGTAGLLYFLNTGPLAVVLGGTLVGFATYVIMCLAIPTVPIELEEVDDRVHANTGLDTGG